jgi:hypothetical protein
MGKFVFYKEHTAGGFLTKECKNLIKQNFEYVLEQNLKNSEESIINNRELTLMAIADAESRVFEKNNIDSVLDYFHSKKLVKQHEDFVAKQLSMKTAFEMKEIAKQEQRVRNEEEVLKFRENTNKIRLENALKEAYSQNLPSRAKNSRKKRTIYTTIKNKMKTASNLLKLIKKSQIHLKFEDFINVHAKDLLTMDRHFLPTKSSSNALESWCLSNAIYDNILESRRRLDLVRLHGSMVDRSDIFEAKQLITEAKSIKEKAYLLDKNIQFVFDFTNSEESRNSDLKKTHVKHTKSKSAKQSTGNINTSEISCSSDTYVDSKDHKDQNKHRKRDRSGSDIPTKWNGFDVDEKLLLAVETLGVPGESILDGTVDNNDDTVFELIRNLSQMFRSKHFVYYCNNILKTKTELTESQKESIHNFFDNPSKAIKWFNTFCVKFEKKEIMKSAMAFGLSRSNNFHLTILTFLSKTNVFD